MRLPLAFSAAVCYPCFKCMRRPERAAAPEVQMPPGRIGVHPNDNTAPLWLRTERLMQLLRAHGSPVETVRL